MAVQFLLPLALTFLLTSVVRDRHNATLWCVTYILFHFLPIQKFQSLATYFYWTFSLCGSILTDLTFGRSVIGRSLQSSWWPTILRAESASTHHVSRRVSFLSSFITLSLFLLGIAGIIKPLGLSDAVKARRYHLTCFPVRAG